MNDTFYDFEDIFNELSDKKLNELSIRDIAKYLLVAKELDFVDENIGDDKVLYKYDTKKLENLSYILEESLFRIIDKEIFYNIDLHEEPKDLELSSNGDDYEF